MPELLSKCLYQYVDVSTTSSGAATAPTCINLSTTQIVFIDFGGMMSLRTPGSKDSVSWTPGYAPVEFEEQPTGVAEATLPSFDIFSLAGVIGAVLTGRSPVELYLVRGSLGRGRGRRDGVEVTIRELGED